jgi:2-dehydro-3-deoxyphosphogluconate aldolase/(4S)-4-hydroxy-2-oxoglutarate aldolase
MMMNRTKVVASIEQAGLVAVIRASSKEQAERITEACIEGGVAAVEITFTVPGAHHLIEHLSKKYAKGEIILGAGTVLDPETTRIAILSGAQYIVSPSINVETIKMCNRYNIAVMPGAMTVKEVIECLELGCDIVKVFPGDLLGPTFIKAVNGPLPQARMMPTGGVDVHNVGAWIKAGAVAVGVDDSLTSGAKNGNYKSITETARFLIEQIKAARSY